MYQLKSKNAKNNRIMKRSMFFILSIILPLINAIGQKQNSIGQPKTYRSLDLIIVDNSQPNGNGMELSEPQFSKLQNIGEYINDKQEPGETLFIFYVCQRTKQNDITNLKSRARYINELQENIYDLPAVFTSDRDFILQRILREIHPFDVTNEINLYCFFPPKYFDNDNFISSTETAKFINVLPREIASLSESDIKIINVHFYVPLYFQNITLEKLTDQLKAIANFKNDDESYPKINFDVQVAN